MSAGPRFVSFKLHIIDLLLNVHVSRYEYLWEDGTKFRRPTKLPAPEYVDALMNWAQNILDDEAIFPNKIGLSTGIFNSLLLFK
jgi:hypothetical protein